MHNHYDTLHQVFKGKFISSFQFYLAIQAEILQKKCNNKARATLNKKTTHMWRRWGASQNFFFVFIDELEKQIIKKNYRSGPIKSKIILIFTMLHFSTPPKNPKNQNSEKWKNMLEVSSFYTCVPKITIIPFLR